jgi:hypothetical protein
MRKKAQLVLIRWVDAAMSCAPHWQPGQRPEAPKKKGLHACETVGFLAHLDEEWAQVYSTHAEGNHAHVTEIPRGMIRSITVLTEGEALP